MRLVSVVCSLVAILCSLCSSFAIFSELESQMLAFTPNVEASLKEIIRLTAAKAFPQLPLVEPLITKGKVSEYQCNNAMGIAKQLSQLPSPVKLSPQAVGEELRKNLIDNSVIDSFEPAPQGFINLSIKKEYISESVRFLLKHGIQPPEVSKQKVLVDFSSPNIAKEMHVGHLRSTIIGDSICLLLKFCGHDVERVNHVGDWGTAFGMLILYMKRNFPNFLEDPPDISDLTGFYRSAKECFDADADFKEKARLEVVKLQAYEPDSIAAWKYICQVSRDEFSKIYSRLGVADLEERGESFYNDLIPTVLKMVEDAGLTEISDGAKLVVSKEMKSAGELTNKDITRLLSPHFVKKTKEGPTDFHPNLLEAMRKVGALSGEEGKEVITLKKKESKPLADFDLQMDVDKLAVQLAPLYKKGLDALLLEPLTAAGVVKEGKVAVPRFNFPLMVVKSDGGFTYDTTDVTCCYHRFAIAKKDRVIYCTDSGQYEHLRMCVQVAIDMGWMGEATWDHAGFGLVTGADGKKIKTRSGEVAKLKDLMDEACERAMAVLQEREAGDRAQGHSEEEMKNLSQVLGIAAIKYYDLKQNRTTDYSFSYDKMLDTAGNTAIFLLYQYARMSSIWRKAEVSEEEALSSAIVVDHPAEKKLGLCLLRFQSVVLKTAEDLLLHHLTDFAYELVTCFSEFFSNCKVVGDPLQNSRLCLIECVRITLRKAMEILNIPVVDRM